MTRGDTEFKIRIRHPAWKESMKRIEAGENRHRVERKALEHYEAVLPKARFAHSVAYSEQQGSEHKLRDQLWLNYTASMASKKLNVFASLLEKDGRNATAAEVRRFMFDVIEPHAGRQCQ